MEELKPVENTCISQVKNTKILIDYLSFVLCLNGIKLDFSLFSSLLFFNGLYSLAWHQIIPGKCNYKHYNIFYMYLNAASVITKIILKI